ncbi:MAG: redox-regulated ATPase YchF [Candidatus Nitrosopumilus sp. MTA1]|uniref:Redox-regulated ATPase YchF n=1 Tax=Marine Group I thaumarchaeote TaxID=2511932 RepID=A0A7K4N5M0_9ARCH|nr:MAG: redox-regulated ATPase YchF [Nitrosopumilus sp. YT1]NMI82653.1 redox-regulated ATPase YchF [Candidatus Nitrosopumilus sp. MTA1]NWJ68534.1 redox-regulated ATPase YchF [Marine Group I thaumarchaeote]NWJ83676.1 redox-regulated ATPase YchF [Marine Group I thaumarchaeote]
MPIKIGLIGKTNTGKTTFFNSATLSSEEISSYPFTTKKPVIGIAHAVTLCVHPEFKIQDNPNNSKCVEGWRYIPIELIDLPGLIKDAWKGKGLGNQFLSIAAQSDALLHVVDASGGIDSTGKITEVGTGDPISDFADIEEELIMWYLKILEGNRDKVSKLIRIGTDISDAITDLYRGIGVTKTHVKETLRATGLEEKDFDDFDNADSKKFASYLRKSSKPTLIVANKIDVEGADKNFSRLRERYNDSIVIPVSGDSEFSLRRAEQKGLIKYSPGSEQFEIIKSDELNEKQTNALNFIQRGIMGEYMRTGVQFAINVAVFKLLKMNSIYPVANEKNLSDKKGRVLPDLLLLKNGATIKDLAKEIHSDLTKGLLYGKDLRYNLRLPIDYQLRDRDVVSIITAAKK